MKSPICFLCNKDFGSEYFHFQTGGQLVKFADYRPLAPGAAGHPWGLEWFCDEHVQAASALSGASSAEALAAMEGKFGRFPPWQEKPRLDPELWVTSVGPNVSKVFAIYRQATQISATEAKRAMEGGGFRIAQGWPVSFKGWQDALLAAGAQVEIRFP